MGILFPSRMAALLVALVSAATAGAHDYWLEESRGRGRGVAIHLRLGEPLGAGEEKGAQRRRLQSFRLYTPDGEADLLQDLRENQRPAAHVPVKQLRGGALVAMERVPARLTLDHEKFNRYLAHEGLDAMTALRAEKKWSQRAGREEYARHLKLFIAGENGVGGTTLAGRELGHRLEILLDADPAALDAGGELPVRVRFEQAPLAHATVDCLHRDAEGKVRRERRKTDAEGRASFPLERVGLHVVRLVHLRSLGENADFQRPEWASDWAAYTFRVGPAEPGTAAGPPEKASPPRSRKKPASD